MGAALCVGDSVMLGASPAYLNTLSMCGTVDAEQSRQFAGAPAAVAAHAPYPRRWSSTSATTGRSAPGVDAVMSQLGGIARVVFVTVQLSGTRSWEEQANGEIRATAGRYSNVAVADWKAASDGHPDYTRSDGIHMSPAGGPVYAATIAAALEPRRPGQAGLGAGEVRRHRRGGASQVRFRRQKRYLNPPNSIGTT